MEWLLYIGFIIFMVILIYFGNVEEIEYRGDRSEHRKHTTDYEDLCQ